MSVGSYNMDNAKNIFFVESKEMLIEMENNLLEIEKGNNDRELMNGIFRAAHTIKGASGMFGFDEIEEFTHVVENILDKTRSDELAIEPKLVELLFDCHDFIMTELNFFETQEQSVLPGEEKARKEYLINELNAYLEKGVETEDINEDMDSEEISVDRSAEYSVLNDSWHISLRFKSDVFRHGLDPRSFISYLGELGDIKSITTLYENMPEAGEMDPESCYLGFEIAFKSNITKEKIEDVFEFVKDDCSIRILPPNESIDEYVSLIRELPEEPMKIGEILVTSGSLTRTELDEALKLQNFENKDAVDPVKKPIGEIIVEEKMIQEPLLEAALNKQQQTKRIEEKNKKLIRIDAEKLDNLINLVGELVINGANVKQLSERTKEAELNEAVSVMSRLIDDIRDSTMNVRMVQIGETFKRFERIVRDLSRDRGKNIKLNIHGGETELDKTLIEKINDPLMHLVRNAVDHGIDYSDERLEKGKPEQGTITLNAYHETGSIVIEVIDDGAGMSREKIFQKAVERGLLNPEQEISDEELLQYIFEPGFSTADKITNISGRGVGMDVVRKNIESLRGSIMLNSREGEGTRVRIHLPLTLAIIDGFMVEVANSYYVFPLDMVVECTEASKDDLDSKEGSNFINLRGDVLPFMKLRDFFRIEGDEPDIANIIIVEYARKKAGLVVDRLIGEFQTVIKPLGKMFNKINWISGSTILGTGEVAFILDVPRVIQNIDYSTSSLKH